MRGSSVESLFLLCELLAHKVELCMVIFPERRDEEPGPAPAVLLQAALPEPSSRGAAGDSERGSSPRCRAPRAPEASSPSRGTAARE